MFLLKETFFIHIKIQPPSHHIMRVSNPLFVGPCPEFSFRNNNLKPRTPFWLSGFGYCHSGIAEKLTGKEQAKTVPLP